MMFYGKPQTMLPEDANEANPLFINEKEQPLPKVEPKMTIRRLLLIALSATLAVWTLHVLQAFAGPYIFSFLPDFVSNDVSVQAPGLAGILDSSFLTTEVDPNLPPVEVLQVLFPLLDDPELVTPVYQTILINETFGNSWGKPAHGSFAVPAGLEYNKVILTLNTSVSGVQYDRLANLFVGGVQIWRTSTVEPGGKNVTSSFSKDVTQYLSLFDKNTSVVFQLDNLLTPKLTGSFNVQLYATFFNETVSESAEAQVISPTEQLLSLNKPASKVHSLTTKSKSKPEEVYLPSDKISVNLPSVTLNTTRLVLSVFTSGNSAEEFWYTDVLSQFSHTFDKFGTTLQGHGPVRIVNVFFNSEKIATQSPQPFIFTGGISPALWSPVVATDAFDLPSIDIDLTALLPNLWESQSITDRILEIEVSNGYDELKKLNPYPQDGIAENWITSANVLAYESELVASAVGEVGEITSDVDVVTVAINPPFGGILQQIINSKANALISSTLNFTFVDGTTLNTTVVTVTKAKTINIQNYKAFGANQSLVHLGTSDKSTTFLDASAPLSVMKKKVPYLAPNAIYQVNTTYTYPVAGVFKQIPTPATPGVIEYDIKLDYGKDVKLAINGTKVIREKVKQKGDSTYYISPEGNHGSGNLTTKFKFDMYSPFPLFSYERDVSVKNNTITSDLVKGGFTAVSEELEPDYYNFVEEISAVSELTGAKIAEIAKEHNINDLHQDMTDIEAALNEPVAALYPPPKNKKFQRPCLMAFGRKHNY